MNTVNLTHRLDGVIREVERIIMCEHPTKQDIAAALNNLANNMESVGTAMDYYGGFNSEMAIHGCKMVCAAQIARQWADQIEPVSEV